MWLEKPLRGWGQGRFGESSGRYRDDGSSQNVEAIESDYLLILVSAGLIGFLPYALFLLTTLWSSLRLFFRRKIIEQGGFLRPETIGLAWSVLACFLLSSFTAINSLPISRLLPFVLFGAIVGSHQYLLAKQFGRQWNLTTRAASVIAPASQS